MILRGRFICNGAFVVSSRFKIYPIVDSNALLLILSTAAGATMLSETNEDVQREQVDGGRTGAEQEDRVSMTVNLSIQRR
jgi:hypothetical protein